MRGISGLPVIVFAGQLKHHLTHHLYHVNARLTDHDQHRTRIDLPKPKNTAHIAAHHPLRIRTNGYELYFELVMDELGHMAGHGVVKG